MTDPFLIEGPACISFSGGRTSGYMLWRILQAHGGVLPEDVIVCFANTGKEMPETLDFVQECSERWSVPIVWLEYATNEEVWKRFVVTNYLSASRDGQPFALRISEKQYLPNVMVRFCTVDLKMKPIQSYMRTVLGFDQFDVVIGIRADEPRRIAKIKANPSGGDRGVERLMPLAEAGVSVYDVWSFWGEQVFDLRLPNSKGVTMHGNCDLCFLKGAKQLESLIRENPDRAIWWMEQERKFDNRKTKFEDGARFSKNRPSYAEMHRMATKHGELFCFDDEALQDCACTD